MAREVRREVEVFRRAVEELGIHFDNLVILANTFDPTLSKTISLTHSYGNARALRDQAHEWLDDLEDQGRSCERDLDEDDDAVA